MLLVEDIWITHVVSYSLVGCVFVCVCVCVCVCGGPWQGVSTHILSFPDDAAPLGPSNMKRSAQDAEVTCAAANVKYGAKTDVCVQAKEGRLHNNFKSQYYGKVLFRMQDRVIKMEQQYSDLQTEKCEMRKQLESCLLLLVAGDIDPAKRCQDRGGSWRSQEQHAAERGEFSLEVEEMERAMEEAEALLLSEI
uniref:Uncharacterized LOC108920771 n=1 Tax=Scleropages formosus TaxID=113540 RepID=A0A8C9U2B8_SCLFO